MKKKFKALLAFVIIAALAVGVYFIFFYKNIDNSQIRVKAVDLNTNQNFITVNHTVNSMISDIEQNPSYQIEDIKNYLNVYITTVNNYSFLYNEIVKNALFVNETNTGGYYKSMNSSYFELEKIYQDSIAYLKNTYLVNKSKDYIVNFNNIFTNALTTLNSFYYNAGMAYITCLNNDMVSHNLYKLQVEYYLTLNSHYVNTFISTKQNSENVLIEITTISTKIKQSNFNVYMDNKQTIDSLWSNHNINKNETINKYLAGEINTYIDALTNQNQKDATTNYFNLVIKG